VCRAERPLECAFNLKPLLLAPEGKVLYELDNSQAELRVAAHLSQDEAMLRAFREGIIIDGKREYDLHTWAQHKLGIPSRKDAKIRVLATFYGQSEEGVGANASLQQSIRQTFKGYVQWSNLVKRLSIVPGLFGRKLFVPPHPNQGHREREAVNSPSQGGAVDVLKLQTHALETKGFDTRHMIHDSVLVMADESDAGHDFLETARETMEKAVTLTVPLKVEAGLWPH
jgi:DNA polymerase-1